MTNPIRALLLSTENLQQTSNNEGISNIFRLAYANQKAASRDVSENSHNFLMFEFFYKKNKPFLY